MLLDEAFESTTNGTSTHRHYFEMAHQNVPYWRGDSCNLKSATCAETGCRTRDVFGIVARP